jgi:hypothetical protein
MGYKMKSSLTKIDHLLAFFGPYYIIFVIFIKRYKYYFNQKLIDRLNGLINQLKLLSEPVVIKKRRISMSYFHLPNIPIVTL